MKKIYCVFRNNFLASGVDYPFFSIYLTKKWNIGWLRHPHQGHPPTKSENGCKHFEAFFLHKQQARTISEQQWQESC